MTMREDLADFDALPNAAKADYYRAKAKRETDTSPEAVERLEEVVGYLLGEVPMDGRWFGDDPPAGYGHFWWRKRLSSDFAALAAKLAEARMQAISDGCQVQEALEAKVAAEAALATAREALLNIAAAKHPDEPLNPYKQMARDALALIERKP